MSEYTIQELSPAQKQIIKDTVPILESSGNALTAKFYSNMLENNPEVRVFFNESDQKTLRQPKILAFALLQYAKNIDDISVLLGFVAKIVSKHVGLQVKPEHYPIVGNNLIATMGALLGPEIATTEFVKAWSIAYGNLAKILIDLEHQEYEKSPWDGFRDFTVTRVVQECADVKSVYFKPSDPEHQVYLPLRGQYVCIRWELPGTERPTSREYSLSQYPKNGEYRISVRLLDEGKVSGFVHSQLKAGDVLKVAPPAGEFVYEDSSKDVVLLIAGIGITPIISILEEALNKGRNVTLLYSNRTTETRPFGKHLSDLKTKFGSRLQITEFFSGEQSGANLAPISIDKYEARPVTAEDLTFITKDHDVYTLGPRPYMSFVTQALAGRAITDVKLEYFGPIEV